MKISAHDKNRKNMERSRGQETNYDRTESKSTQMHMSRDIGKKGDGPEKSYTDYHQEEKMRATSCQMEPVHNQTRQVNGLEEDEQKIMNTGI